MGINDGEAIINNVMIIGTINIHNEAIRTTTKEEEKEIITTNNKKGKKWKTKDDGGEKKIQADRSKKMLNEV